jgi:SulP family sulfate permease
MNKLRKLFPMLNWLSAYNMNWFKGDLTAGVTVGVMLIPQGMAYAMVAGLPPEYGLYASLIPLIVYAVFGTSRQLAIGPVAMDSLFVAATISILAVAEEEPVRYIQLAILLAAMIGIVQLFFGAIRLGFLVNFISRPVIVGFTSAAAIIIGATQLKFLFAVEIPRQNQLHLLFYDLISATPGLHWGTLLFGISAIGLLIGLRQMNKKIPSALILVTLSIALVYFFNLGDKGIHLIGVIPSGLPTFQVPTFNLADIRLLLPAAVALAIIGYMEAISIGKSLEEKHDNYKISPNQELLALGMSNLSGSFFQSYPVTGGFSRSAVNNEAGAKTGLASIISAGIIVLTLLFLTNLFYYLPTVILAAIILVAVAGLIDFKAPFHLWKTDKKEFGMYAATLIATLEIGVVEGIVIGVIFSLIVLIYKVTVPHMAVLGKVEGQHVYRNIKRFPDVKVYDDILIVRFDARLFYANMNYFQDQLRQLQEERSVKHIVIDASGINSVDSSAIHMLRKMKISFNKRNVRIYFAGLKGPVRDSFEQNKIYSFYGMSQFFLSIQEAIDYIQRKQLNEMNV